MSLSLPDDAHQYKGIAGYGYNLFPFHSKQRAVEHGIYPPHTIGTGLKDIIGSGIKVFGSEIKMFQIPVCNGALTITQNAQLIPNSDSSSNNFCILNFKDASGQLQTFEIDLKNNTITVARQQKKDPKTMKTVVTTFLGHSDMMPLLEKLVREAKTHMATLSQETQVSDEQCAIHASVEGVL